MEVLGYRRESQSAIAALCSGYKLLAVATPARGDVGDGDRSSGVASRVEILRLWRGEGEPSLQRPLQKVATIPCEAEAGFHSIAWSASPCETYPLGLLAAGLDGGVVRIWDPSELYYDSEGELPMPEIYIDPSLTLAVFAGPFLKGHPSKLSYMSRPGLSRSDSHFPDPSLTNEMENARLRMRKELEALQMDPFATDAGGWDIVKKEDEWVDVHKEMEDDNWELVSKELYKDTHATGTLLKLEDLKGPVRGLAFNHQKKSWLAAAAFGSILQIYDINREISSSYKVSLPSKSQNTFLNWNPRAPSILASCSDDGYATIFDITTKKPLSRIKHSASKYFEIHWSPDTEFVFALSSDTNPIKVYDLRRPGAPTHTFGPAKGVRSLSWSSSAQSSVISTSIDGTMDLWKLNNERSAEHFSLHLSGKMEKAHWCGSEDAVVISSSDGVTLCKLESPW